MFKEITIILNIAENELAIAQSREAATNGTKRNKAYEKLSEQLELYKTERKDHKYLLLTSEETDQLEKLDRKGKFLQDAYDTRHSFVPNTDMPESYQTMGIDSAQVMQQVEERRDRMDEDLGSVLKDTERLKYMANDFNREVDEQTALLSRIDENMDIVHNDMEALTEKTDKVALQPRRQSCRLCVIIWLLMAIIIGLLFL